MGGDGIARAAVKAAGGAIALTRKAFRCWPLAVVMPAAKTIWVESGNHVGWPMSPLATVVVAACPVKLRTRRAMPPESSRRYAMRFAVGDQLRALTSPLSVTRSYRYRKPTA